MKKIMLFCTMLIILAGCGKEEEIPKMLNVDLAVDPIQGQVKEPVKFQAKVTYGDDKVKDADDVSFEIWLANSADHEKIAAKHIGNGIYEIVKTFDEEGTYYVYAHVTARDSHNMPKEEFVIGKPSPPEQNDGKKEMDEMDEEDMN
ncbi:FixH family protein [Peribacillus sp. SI8-4]|uniref:FixH family protein n=1 Tax=Peribacillus sp. SI8-4 TaxID=3048009 RepID=UPI0025571A99|nr:FixH family protein [Peribacillus sp. SI8-4]